MKQENSYENTVESTAETNPDETCQDENKQPKEFVHDSIVKSENEVIKNENGVIENVKKEKKVNVSLDQSVIQENYQIERGLKNEKQTSENSSPNKMLPFENQRNSGDFGIQHNLKKRRNRRFKRDYMRLKMKATLYMNKALELNVPEITNAAIKVGDLMDKRRLKRKQVFSLVGLIKSHMEKIS